MIKYAKIVDDETKKCDVGLGTNTGFYESIGMTEMEVEQTYNGAWYVTGYAPKETEAEKKAKRKAELIAELDALDLKCIRALRAIQAGTGTDDDTARLAELEEQAGDIRQQIQDLQGE